MELCKKIYIYVCEYKNNVENVASFRVTVFSLVQLYRGNKFKRYHAMLNPSRIFTFYFNSTQNNRPRLQRFFHHHHILNSAPQHRLRSKN